MSYNPNIHHRKSIRLKGYDYSQEGLYFITICCANRLCLFGEVVDGALALNEGGIVGDECWNAIPRHFPNAILHEYIVMPNHVHGIIELMHGDDDVMVNGVVGRTKQHAFQKMIPRSVGSIVKGFKIGVTKWFRQHTDIETVWQRNYYEHIIRNETSYRAISNYIMNNPAKWQDDKFYR